MCDYFISGLCFHPEKNERGKFAVNCSPNACRHKTHHCFGSFQNHAEFLKSEKPSDKLERAKLDANFYL